MCVSVPAPSQERTAKSPPPDSSIASTVTMIGPQTDASATLASRAPCVTTALVLSASMASLMEPDACATVVTKERCVKLEYPSTV